MKILVISDLHGDFSLAVQACEEARPELLLCCGDWGDAEEVTAADLDRFLGFCPVLTTFGNHDPLDLLTKTRNRDGSNVLLGQGETRNVKDLTLASIGGIWAKSHRLPHYVTDQDVARYAHEIASRWSGQHPAHARVPDWPGRPYGHRPPRWTAMLS